MRGNLARPDYLAPTWWEIATVAGLLPLYWSTGLQLGIVSYDFANAIGPAVLAAILLTGAAHQIFSNSAAILTGLFWFRVATAVYFGVGSVVGNFLDYGLLVTILQFFYPNKELVTEFNAITAASVTSVLATVALMSILFPARGSENKHSAENRRLLLIVALLFAGVGYSIRYLIVVPYNMDAYGYVILPGMLLSLGLLAPPALFLLTLWSLRYKPVLIPLLITVTLLDSFTGVLLFSKTDALLPPFLFVIALLYHKMTVLRSLIAAAIIIFAFQAMQPAVLYGRTELLNRYGSGVQQSSLGERLEILTQYIKSDFSPAKGVEQSLARIAYVYSATPAIEFYDYGMPGNSLDEVFSVVIPRFLWPDKPVYDHGTRYTQMINGSDTSSTWMGYFAEAYWNLGWTGIPLTMMPLGIAFFLFGRYTLSILQRGRWLHFPNVFLGMMMGVQVDGSLITGAFMTCFVAVIYHFAANMGTTFISWSMPIGRARTALLPLRYRQPFLR